MYGMVNDLTPSELKGLEVVRANLYTRASERAGAYVAVRIRIRTRTLPYVVGRG